MIKNRDVIKNFLSSLESKNTNLCSKIDNNCIRLFSYSTIIAQRINSQFILLNETKYSCTTSRHLTLLKDEIKKYYNDNNIHIFTVDNIDLNTQYL